MRGSGGIAITPTELMQTSTPTPSSATRTLARNGLRGDRAATGIPNPTSLESGGPLRATFPVRVIPSCATSEVIHPQLALMVSATFLSTAAIVDSASREQAENYRNIGGVFRTPLDVVIFAVIIPEFHVAIDEQRFDSGTNI